MSFPQLDPYDAVGHRVDRIRHHGAYADVGDVIYGSGVVSRLVRPGGLREGLAFHFLNCMLGEAGHNCPVICNFETARLLVSLPGVRDAAGWAEGLCRPSYRANLTASQFLTEVTGGSDVGANATIAWRDDGDVWRIRGEKWFASNADADLNVITARFAPEIPGTRGLSVFLVPRRLPDGTLNTYTLRRLKEKFGTRALATAEIDFHDAWAIPLAADVKRGFAVMMQDVVHHSRVALAVSCAAMAARAYAVARAYADERTVFGRRVIDHVLARENLSRIRSHVLAMQAGLWSLIARQDAIDLGRDRTPEQRAFVRLLANAYKHETSRACVDHCHHALDTLGGNGTIETFSPIPRLLRDAVIEENWEGTHNTVRAQTLRDILRHDVDEAWVSVMRSQISALGANPAAVILAARVQTIISDLRRVRSTRGDEQALLLAPLLTDLVRVSAYGALIEEVEAGLDAPPVASVKRAAVHLFERQYLANVQGRYSQEDLRAIDTVVEHGPS